MTDRNTDPKYARESFTWRTMKPWQIGAIAAAAVVFLIVGFMVL